MRWAWILVGVVGCIQPSLQPCGDLLCATDSVCLPDNTCATQESLDVCAGKADGDTCTTTLFTGSCAAGVCRSPRCGDGIVSGSEQCDGAVADVDVDCVAYGFDTGVPSCSDRCSLDVVGSCVRFGWERVLAKTAYKAWTNGTLFALITPDRENVQIYQGTQLIQDLATTDRPHDLVGNGSSVAAVMDARIVVSDSGGPWHDIDVSALPDANLTVTMADDGTLYAGVQEQNRTRIWRHDVAAWTSILDVALPSTTLVSHDNLLYVGYDNGDVRRYQPGGPWSSTLFTLPSAMTDIAFTGANNYVVTTDGSGAFDVSGSTVTNISSNGFTQILPLPDALYIGGNENFTLRRIAGQFEQFDAPIYGFLITDGTSVFVYGNGIYRFTGTQYTQRDGLSALPTDATLLGDGTFAMSSMNEVLTDLDGELLGYNSQNPDNGCVAVAGASPADYYAAGPDLLQHCDGATKSDVALPNGIPLLLDLAWDPATSTLYATGEQGLGMKRVGTTWTRFPDVAGCNLTKMALHASTVYVAATCGSEGVIYQLMGATWSELHRSSVPFASMWADASDNLYATGPAGGLTRIGGTWHDEPRAAGMSISATGPDDIWVGGGVDDILHWDGMLWARVRVVGPATPMVVATPRAIYIAGSSASVLIR